MSRRKAKRNELKKLARPNRANINKSRKDSQTLYNFILQSLFGDVLGLIDCSITTIYYSTLDNAVSCKVKRLLRFKCEQNDTKTDWSALKKDVPSSLPEVIKALS